MAFILFETGSAKWLKSTGFGKHQFTSNMDEATPYSSAWTLEEAVNNIGASRYKDTIVAHSQTGKRIKVRRSSCNDVAVRTPIVTAEDLILRLVQLKGKAIGGNTDIAFKLGDHDLIVTNVDWNEWADQIEITFKKVKG